MPSKAKPFLKTNIVLFLSVLFALSMHSALAQSPVNAGISRSSEEVLKGRVDAQQREIDELKQMVRQLQTQVLRPTAYNRATFETAVFRPERRQPPVLAITAASLPESAFFNNEAGPGAPEPPAPAPAPVAAVQPTTPRELLPAIGYIGAQVGFLLGGSQNPFKANNGFFTGGYIDLPLKKVPGGKLSYEILVSLQRSTTRTPTTSAANVLVNAIANVELGTPPGLGNLFGPLPITSVVKERSTVLSVVPVEFKYTVTALDRLRVRPYAVVGLGTYVGLSSQNNTQSFDATKVLGAGALASAVNALLQGPQIGGVVPAAPELRARGVPNGQGDVRFGIQYGGGLEFRFSPKYSFGFDYRQNHLEGINSGFNSFTFKQGIHF